MERRIASAEEIRQQIEARLNSQPDMIEAHTQLNVPLPERKEPDASGCNWKVGFTDDVAGHEDTVSRVVSEMQGMVNLAQ